LAGTRTLSALKEKISKIITELTENASLVYFKNLKRVSFLNHLAEEIVLAQKIREFVEEDAELFIEGVARIFEQPEFQDLRKIRILLHAFDDKYDFIQLLFRDLQEQGVQVHIGGENTIRDLEDVSVVAKDCYVAHVAIGSVAVVGPTRMKYPKIVSVIEYVADTVTHELERF
jgi:heat-inducible transcriptional repressor